MLLYGYASLCEGWYHIVDSVEIYTINEERCVVQIYISHEMRKPKIKQL